MSITTRQGDSGQTRLFGGERVSKNHPRLEALGDLDELVSALGVARAHLSDPAVRARLLQIQRELFLIGSEAAVSPDRAEGLPGRIGPDHCNRMDAWCADLERRAGAPRDFILPGENVAGAHLDLARAIARRCERRIVALADAGAISNPHLLQWINRLSDALWLLARTAEGRSRPLHGSPP